jgi:FkbM family methyltransferase
MVTKNLIFDVGMHKGEDTDFYLKKGFHVIGVEANPLLSDHCVKRFQSESHSGQLTIVNKAIAEYSGVIDFYVNENSVWGTANRDWMLRNQRLGAKSHMIQVPSVRMDDLLSEYGTPYYMKVDIEGLDYACITALISQLDKPRYVSVETHAWSYVETIKLLTLLCVAGYNNFKIVSQLGVRDQVCPNPAREGVYVDYRFLPDASGLFGEELPGGWLSRKEVKSQLRRAYFHTWVLGPHHGILRRINKNRYAAAVLNRLFPSANDWFDIHAELQTT